MERLRLPSARLAVCLLLAALACVPLRSVADGSPVLYDVMISPGGDVDRASLDAAVERVRRDHPGGPKQLVAFIHGYAATLPATRSEYRVLAQRLAVALGPAAAETAFLGIHWASCPGPPAAWVTRALEHRLLKPAGMGEKVADPYDTVVWRAHGAGRRGLREALFAFREAFPGAAVHLVTHSLGSCVALNALAPDLTPDRRDVGPAFMPERELRVDGLFLAGADLDGRLFVSGEQAPAARAALGRARLWWFTVPRAGEKDRVLQVRQIDVGRRAIGNCGPRFLPEDADRLLSERRLVLDLNGVPSLHWFLDYYGTPRMKEIALAMDRLAGTPPVKVAGSRQVLDGGSVAGNGAVDAARLPPDTLGALDDLLAREPNTAELQPYLGSSLPTLRVYAAWKLGRAAGRAAELFGTEFTVRSALRAADAARE